MTVIVNGWGNATSAILLYLQQGRGGKHGKVHGHGCMSGCMGTKKSLRTHKVMVVILSRDLKE